MEVTREDVGNASQAFDAAGLAREHACDWSKQVVDYLDHIRRHYQGSHFPSSSFFKKQALDWTIALIHETQQQVLKCP